MLIIICRGSLPSQFKGLQSVHYVGDVSRDPNGVDPREFHGLGRVRNPDGVFKVSFDNFW